MKNTLERPYVTKYGTAPKAIYDVVFQYEGDEEKTITHNNFAAVEDTLKTLVEYKAASIKVIRYKDGEEKDVTAYCMRRI